MTRIEAIKRLKELQHSSDIESDHYEADRILVELLDTAGFEAVTKEYLKVPKWYA